MSVLELVRIVITSFVEVTLIHTVASCLHVSSQGLSVVSKVFLYWVTSECTDEDVNLRDVCDEDMGVSRHDGVGPLTFAQEEVFNEGALVVESCSVGDFSDDWCCHVDLHTL